MNHCSIPVRRSLYLLFGSFLFGQCSIIFFFQCGMIFFCQTVWSSKSVNNYMLVDADFVTSLNYWWSPWKSYLKIWNTPEVSVLKHQSKGNQRSIRSCYYDWHMLIYCMRLSLVIQPIMNRASFYLYLCLRLYWKHERPGARPRPAEISVHSWALFWLRWWILTMV